MRSPAEGLWKDETVTTIQDDVLPLEVMIDVVDCAWWHAFQEGLKARLGQQEMVIRAQQMELL